MAGLVAVRPAGFGGIKKSTNFKLTLNVATLTYIYKLTIILFVLHNVNEMLTF